MPKHKSVRGASKRFRKTGTGKVKRKKAFLRHILTKKTTKNKRGLRKSGLIADSDMREIRDLLPYL
ncbi:MAG: 50S ribosomal protein L35 [Nitrospinae bacterium]|nr:50S ribosomal protein L35 [Nitrospinota bacterium]